MDVTTLIAAVAILLGLPGLMVALHLGVLADRVVVLPRASCAGRVEDPVPGTRSRTTEEKVIARGLEAIMADRREGDAVLVVADRCTDRTAAVARSLGAAASSGWRTR